MGDPAKVQGEENVLDGWVALVLENCFQIVSLIPKMKVNTRQRVEVMGRVISIDCNWHFRSFFFFAFSLLEYFYVFFFLFVSSSKNVRLSTFTART